MASLVSLRAGADDMSSLCTLLMSQPVRAASVRPSIMMKCVGTSELNVARSRASARRSCSGAKLLAP